MSCVHLLLCLQIPCSSVLHKSLTPLGAPLSVGEGQGVRPYHRKRENQINTLVLKDINFTINIIELSYYRTIDTLNQPKNAPVVKASPSPSEGGDVHNPTYRLSFVSNYIQ